MHSRRPKHEWSWESSGIWGLLSAAWLISSWIWEDIIEEEMLISCNTNTVGKNCQVYCFQILIWLFCNVFVLRKSLLCLCLLTRIILIYCSNIALDFYCKSILTSYIHDSVMEIVSRGKKESERTVCFIKHSYIWAVTL